MMLKKILQYSNSIIDTLGLYVKAKNMILIKVYRLLDNPAGGHRSANVEFMRALNDVKNIFSSLKTPAPDILLCGDFNLPHFSWPYEVLK